MACSVPALQPLFKKWFDSRSTKGADTPGARNNPVLLSWDDSTGLTLFSRPQSAHSTTDHGNLRGEEFSYSLEELPAKGVRGTTDVERVYPEGRNGWGMEETVPAKEVHLV